MIRWDRFRVCWRRAPTRAISDAILAGTATVGMVIPTLLCAPGACAEPDGAIERVVAAMRGSAPCRPLKYDPIVEHGAEIANRSTIDFVQHAARNVPVADPLPVLKDLGSKAQKAYMLQGFGQSDADAIKGAVLQGYAAIPDCAYTAFGASLMTDDQTGRRFALVILTGG